jgi:uncharacterized repeat protein (TIGR01451 family)
VQNTVTVAATTPDPVSANNTASVVSTLKGVADLRAVLTVPTGNIPLGSTFPYQLTLSNQGPSTAVNTRIARLIAPSGINPVSLPTSSSCSTAGCSPPSSAYCSLAGCTLPPLAPGDWVVVKGTAQVATTTAPGRATVTVTVTSDTADPNPADNDGSAVLLVGAPSLQVSVLGAITDNRRTRGADVGDDVVWTYVVTNAGDVDVTALSVVLPGGTTAVPTTCRPGTLPKGRSAACRVVASQSVTAADVTALAVKTTVQAIASWVGGTEVRSPSASGSLVTVLPPAVAMGSSTSIQANYLSAAATPTLQVAASRTEAAALSTTPSGQTTLVIGVLLAVAAGTALAIRPLRRRS